MAKPKRQWHICDDCLDPIAEGLFKLTRRHAGQDDVLPAEFDNVLRSAHFEFGIAWLKICVSVDFARDIERAVKRPLRRYEKLHRMCSMRVGSSVSGYVGHICITRCIDWDWANDKTKRDLDQDERPESETENQYSDIVIQLRKTIEFLRHSSPILRSLIERRGVKLKEIPLPGSRETPTIPPEHRTIAMNGVWAACLWKGISPKTVNKKKRAAVRAEFRRALGNIEHEREGKRYILNFTKLPAKSQKFLESL